MTHFFEWLGTLGIIGGTSLIAFKFPVLGLVSYIIGSLAWAGYGFCKGSKGIVITNFTTLGFSIFGIVNWLV